VEIVERLHISEMVVVVVVVLSGKKMKGKEKGK
jgi:hypothetical protein